MPGETDLTRLLASLDPVVRPGTFVVVTRPHGEAVPELDAHASIREDEGTTHVLLAEDAAARGWPAEGPFAWITLQVHSSFAAVGMTAAVARALADHGISANVLAAFHHDHLLVPADRADDAVNALRALAAPT